jgi:hypothetical protein
VAGGRGNTTGTPTGPALACGMASRAARQLGDEAARQLRGATIAPGLSDAECARVEDRFGFEFAEDHRAFLQAGPPTTLYL